MSKTSNWIIIIVIVLLLVLGIKTLGSKKENTKESNQVMTPISTPTTSANKTNPAPAMEIDTKKSYQAVLKTSQGNITIDLFANQTPITVNNFIHLSKTGFYNNTIFHRVIKGFMIQGGDPNGNGTGGPGYKFDDEKFEGKYEKGTVAMANSGPNTNGSQFFIMHKDYPLPKNYVIFGKVSSGLDVVDKIAEAAVKQTGEMSTPVSPVVINEVEVLEK